MNNTEPKIFVINTHDEWVEGKASPVFEQNESGGLTLLMNQLYLNEGSTSVGFKVQDFATDGCDTFYILTTDNKLVLYDKDTGVYTYIDCIDLTDSQYIAVTMENVYILQKKESVKYYNIICYARANYQIRWEMVIACIQENFTTQKIKIANTISDILPASPCDININSVTADKNDNIYIISNNTIYKFNRNTDNQPQEFYSFPSDNKVIDIAVDKDGDIYCIYKDTVYKADIIHVDENNEKSTKTILLPLPAIEQFKQFAINPKGMIYTLNDKNKVVTIQKENRFKSNRQYITKVFDSKILGCQWHRIILDTGVLEYTNKFRPDVTGNTRIEVSYYVSDDEFESDPNLDWSSSLINPSDALIIEAKGKYICFKIELFSDDQQKYAPYIHSFSVEFPHHSYLQYLPAVYQEDKEGSEFLARYLSLFESFLGKTEKEIHSATRYIDAYGTPDEFLSWLAQWLSIGYDENWSKDKLRELIKQAPQLYKIRGTRIGLEKLLNIYMGKGEVNFVSGSKCYKDNNKAEELINDYKTFDDTSIIIREHFAIGRCTSDESKLGEVSILEDTSDFDESDFGCCYSAEKLYEAVVVDKYELGISTKPTIAWLNELLSKDLLYSKVRAKYSCQLPSDKLLNKKTIYDQSQSTNNLKQLNRILLEEYYPELTPKQNFGNIMKFIFNVQQVTGLQPDDTLKVVIAGKGLYGLITNIKEKDDNHYIVSINIVNTSCDSGEVNTKAVVYRVHPEEVLYGDDPYSFDVLLRPFGIKPKEAKTKLEAVRKLVDREKPAHTEACVRLLEPLISLGSPTYLGINTILSEPVYAVVGEGILFRDTILSDREPSGQADVRGRVNIDTKLT